MIFRKRANGNGAGKSRNGGRPGLTRRVKMSALMTLTAFCCALTVAAVFSGSMVCYAVSYEGTDLGTVSDRAELDRAIQEAEEIATDILGQECSLASSITVTADIGASQGDEGLTEKLLASVEGIAEGYAITVDGKAVGTMDSPEQLWDILTSILEGYSTENTVSIGFAQTVAVEYTFISQDLCSDPEEIAAMLSPDNEDSQFSLDVISSENVEILDSIPMETKYEYSDQMYSDERELIQEGSDGVMSTRYIVQLVNGQEISRMMTGSGTISQPVEQIIEVGTLPGSRTDSTGSYIWPTDGNLTSDFGNRSVAVGSSNHKGIDIAGPVGTDVWAADGGTVIYAQYWSGSGYGNIVMIEHDNGDITYYAHLDSISVQEGDEVAQGDIIGAMGATGNVSGSHLHFEVRPGGGEPANPLNYLP